MKFFPRALVGFLCALFAALVSSQAQNSTLPLPGNGSTTTSGGSLTLSGTNTFSGSTTVTGGTLQVGPTVPTGTAGTVTLNGTGLGGTPGIVNVTKTGTGTLTFGTTAGTIITAGSGATLTLVGTGATVFSGIGTISSGIGVNTGVTLSSGGTLTLGPSNGTISRISPILFAGGSTLNLGIAGGTLATTSPLLTSGGTLTLNLTGTLSVPANSTFTVTPFTAPITLNGGATLAASNFNLPVSTGLTINTSAGESLKLLPTIGSTGSTTKVTFLGGATSNAGSVSLSYLPSILNLAGNPLEVHMSEFDSGLHDKYVLQLSYNPATAGALGDLSKLYLAWYDPADGTWKNAVDGDSDGGTSAKFVGGAYDPNTDFNLGTYGVDTANSTVWAVVDHNSTFGVANSALQPQGVPEPSVTALLVCGVALQMRRSRKR